MVQIDGLDQLLGEHPFFEGLDDEARKIVSGCAANERFDADQYIFRNNDPADKFYLIRQGVVALEFHVPGHDPIILETLHDGEIFGWSWLVPPYCWTGDARAVKLSRLVSLDAKCLRAKLEDDHSLGYEMLSRFIPIIARRLEAARIQMIDVYGSPKG